MENGTWLHYYAFALFISGLICLIAVLCKILFSDLKRQKKLLDEKETKLLQLYNTVESIMEEFADQVKATKDELSEYENRPAKRSAAAAAVAAAAAAASPETAQTPAPAKKEKPADKPSRSTTVDATRIKAASDVLERAERINKIEMPKPASGTSNGTVFQKFFDDTEAEVSAEEAEEQNKKTRNEQILALAAEGKTDAQIASELGITRNEVKLVIGLTKKK